jgi:uncharacterized protein (TIGR00369 family)
LSNRVRELYDRFEREPLAQHYGISIFELRAGVVAGSPVVAAAELVMPTRTHMAIVGGLVQGGVITVLADYAGVYAAMAAVPAGHVPCQHININFLRPTMIGETVRALAESHYVSRSVVHTRVTVIGLDARVRAEAMMEFARPLR